MSGEEGNGSEGEVSGSEGEDGEIPDESKIPRPKPEGNFEERYKELVDSGLSRKKIAKALYDAGFQPKDIMMKHLPIVGLKDKPSPEVQAPLGPLSPAPTSTKSEHVQAAMMGRVRGEGYLDDLKDMIKYQISRSREFTEAFYNIGLGGIFAALVKSGLRVEDFRKLTGPEAAGHLREAMQQAGDTIFKALEAYNTDILPKIEAERDEARFAAAQFEAQYDDLKRRIEPMNKVENMIYKLAMLSGTSKVDPLVINELLDRWLSLQFPLITAEGQA